jgi:phage portal protein BeeE
MDKNILSTSELNRLVNRMMVGQVVSWSNYDRQQIVEVYKTNSYIFSIVNKIARAAKSINVMAGNYVDGSFVENPNGKLAKLWATPSKGLSTDEFIERLTLLFYLFGEDFIYYQTFMAGNDAKKIIPGSIQIAPPQVVDIKHENLVPTAYIIDGNTAQTIDAANMIHIKAFNPDFEDLHGLPYVAVASRLIDKLNAADETETKTYQNGGPAYLVSPNVPGAVEDTTFKSFIDRLKTIWKGSDSKRGVAGVNIPVKLERIGQNPSDMGVFETQTQTLNMLLVAWGLDPGLFSTEASTYNNKQVMERAIYTEAAIPFVKKLINKLNDIVQPIYGEILEIDTSDIEVLQPNFRDKAEWMTLAGVYSNNEIRTATMYPARDSEDSDKTPLELMDSTALKGFDTDVIEKPIIGKKQE